MPEAAIHKDGDSLFWEHEIWLSKQSIIAPPPGDAFRLEDGDELQLGCPVTAAAYTGHVVRAFFGAVDINHIGCLRSVSSCDDGGLLRWLRHTENVAAHDFGQKDWHSVANLRS